MDKNTLSEAPRWIEFSRRHKLAMESINHRNRQILHLKKELRKNLNLLTNHGSPRASLKSWLRSYLRKWAANAP